MPRPAIGDTTTPHPMLLNTNALKGIEPDNLDGKTGGISGFYFDDRHWAVRHLVADTGGWLTGRLVLISPSVLPAAQAEHGSNAVNLTKLVA